jgi:alkylation response protein AidB-like acyl-CoA dehydrogenase
MRFTFTPDQEKFRQEIEDFCAEVIDEVKADPDDEEAWSNDGHWPALHKNFAERGYLALQWPKEYGGQGRTAIEASIFHETLGYYRMPSAAFGLTIKVVGNSILHFGSEAQKQKYVRGIARGEMIICQGFSEPNAGSDLGSLQTRAVEDGDDYVINGQKVFTTLANISDYVFLLTRTNPHVPKHKGISMFIVPMDAPGVSVRPMWALDGGRTNETFYDNVRVPKENLIGEKDRGWYQSVTSLDYERSGTTLIGRTRRTLDEMRAFCHEHGLFSERPVLRYRLAELYTQLEVLRGMSYRVAWMQSRGIVPNKEASMNKLYGTELLQRVASFGLQVLGLYGLFTPQDDRAPQEGRTEQMYRNAVVHTIFAGSNEIQRNIIAQRGLGLPR